MQTSIESVEEPRARPFEWWIGGSCLGALALVAGCATDGSPFPEPGMGAGGGGFTLVVPTDIRPAALAETPPAPISGGTLAVTRDGRFAIAADSQRDRISVVSLEVLSVTAEIPLSAGEEPGRVIEDESGTIHVVARRSGDLISIDPASWAVSERRHVCAAPRGIAAQGSTLHIACAEGKLVTLPLTGATPIRVLDNLPNDLRDVVVRGDGLVVSRFRAAELLYFDAAGTLTARQTLPGSTVRRESLSFPEQPDPNLPVAPIIKEEFQAFAPTTAWRMVAAPDGTIYVSHQQALADPIDLDPEDDPGAGGSGMGGGPSMGMPPGGSPYGSSCGTIVRTQVSVVALDGSVTVLPGSERTLPTDLAISSNGTLAVVNATGVDPAAPTPMLEFTGESGGTMGTGGSAVSSPPPPLVAGPGFFGGTGLGVIPSGSGGTFSLPPGEPVDECFGTPIIPMDTPRSVAVAISPASNDQVIIAQAYEPPALHIVNASSFESTATIPLGGKPIQDTGHDLFHLVSGAGIACASCHPEGGDDGHAWNFEGHGLRRTQPLDVHLQNAAPFHWDGALPDLKSLMTDVFVGRMGGVHQSPERMAALERWLFALKPPAAPELDAAAVDRGRVLFESPTTLCNTCHTGPSATNNVAYNVGTADVLLQVPSLIGIGYRSSFMHTACAKTLEERFNPACGGGDLHGKTSHLTPEQIADLVTYMRSL